MMLIMSRIVAYYSVHRLNPTELSDKIFVKYLERYHDFLVFVSVGCKLKMLKNKFFFFH